MKISIAEKNEINYIVLRIKHQKLVILLLLGKTIINTFHRIIGHQLDLLRLQMNKDFLDIILVLIMFLKNLIYLVR